MMAVTHMTRKSSTYSARCVVLKPGATSSTVSGANTNRMPDDHDHDGHRERQHRPREGLRAVAAFVRQLGEHRHECGRQPGDDQHIEHQLRQDQRGVVDIELATGSERPREGAVTNEAHDVGHERERREQDDSAGQDPRQLSIDRGEHRMRGDERPHGGRVGAAATRGDARASTSAAVNLKKRLRKAHAELGICGGSMRRRASMPNPSRHSRRLTTVVAVLVGALLWGITASGVVWTDTFGAGQRLDHLVDKVRLALDPPPDRDTVPTIEITELPEPALADPDSRRERQRNRGRPSDTATQAQAGRRQAARQPEPHLRLAAHQRLVRTGRCADGAGHARRHRQLGPGTDASWSTRHASTKAGRTATTAAGGQPPSPRP